MRLNYYHIAREASLQIGSHPGLLYLQQLCQSANRILDAGCGEGSRLHTLLPKNKFGWGIDINSKAISMAKKQYSRHKFLLSSPVKFPFPNNYFDVVYSAFVLEHTRDPVNFLNEMIRVCQPRGYVVILCPNFGSPNRRSPNSIQNPILKLLKGFIDDFFGTSVFRWEKVQPKPVYNLPDDDTTTEPYLLSLIRFFQSKKLTINLASSLWDLEDLRLSPRKIFVKTLGQLSIFPFIYWGPQIFISVTKRVSD